MKPLKWLTLALLALTGCASLRSWGDQDLLPGPPPVVGIAVGAMTNGALIVLKRPWYERVLATGLVSYAGRFTPLIGGHRNEGWHIEVSGGAVLGEWFSWIWCQGPCEASR